MSEAKQFKTPVGELQWVFITGKGKKDLNDNDRFTASVVLDTDSDAGQAMIQEINDFWEEFKPKGVKNPKSLGFRYEVDDEGNETGKVSFNFWTGITFPDGSPKVIKIFNAKGAEVSLGSKKIGNGSRGRIGGAMAIYANGKAASGVTLYLNSIQLSKFIEFTGSDSFDAIDEDDEEAFTGVDDGMEAMSEAEQSEAPAQPRL